MPMLYTSYSNTASTLEYLFGWTCSDVLWNLVDACVNSPCKNGGTCTTVNKEFHCQCSVLWQGKDCTKGEFNIFTD